MSRLSFAIGWKSTVLTALVVPLCLSLGVWQLQRAEQKTAIAAMYDARHNMAPMTLAEAAGYEDKTHLPVILRGEFVGRHWLLENQWRHKVLGVDVLSLFLTNDGQHVLVNRGWLENRQRDSNPSFETPTGPRLLLASVYQPSKAPYSLGDLILQREASLERISYLDIAQISRATGLEIYPQSVRLNAQQAESFDTQWPQINVKPETHTGYAVQWFLFAVVAFAVYIFANSNIASLLRKRDS